MLAMLAFLSLVLLTVVVSQPLLEADSRRSTLRRVSRPTAPPPC
jgi:hypothetical protein